MKIGLAPSAWLVRGGGFVLASALSWGGCSGETPSSPNQQQSPAVESVSENEVITLEPLTVVLTPDESLREALRRCAASDQKGQRLRLSIQGVAPPEGAAGVRVFLNLPGALPESYQEDPHYVGEFTFFPSGKDAPPQSFLLDAAKVVRKLAETGSFDAEAPIKLTLVAVPLGTQPEDVGEVRIGFEKVVLSAPQ